MIAANSYSASLTREQFLFKETRIVAQLMDKHASWRSLWIVVWMKQQFTRR